MSPEVASRQLSVLRAAYARVTRARAFDKPVCGDDEVLASWLVSRGPALERAAGFVASTAPVACYAPTCWGEHLD